MSEADRQTDRVEQLLAALRDDNEALRDHAVASLGQMGVEALPRLIGLLADEDMVIREAGTSAIVRIGPAAVGPLVEALDDDEWAVREQAARRSARPRVACLEWFDPIYAAGHWIPEMVELAGGHDVLGRKGEPSEKINWQTVVELVPDVIVLMPCGFDTQRTAQEATALNRLEGWHELPAVRSGKVFAVNGHAFFSRPGPRLVDGLEILAEIIHPESFSRQTASDSVQRIL